MVVPVLLLQGLEVEVWMRVRRENFEEEDPVIFGEFLRLYIVPAWGQTTHSSS